MIMFWVSLLASHSAIRRPTVSIRRRLLFGLAKAKPAWLDAEAPCAIWDGNETWLVVTACHSCGALLSSMRTLLVGVLSPLIVMLRA